jgi:hypothetical protein
MVASLSIVLAISHGLRDYQPNDQQIDGKGRDLREPLGSRSSLKSLAFSPFSGTNWDCKTPVETDIMVGETGLRLLS